MVSVKDIHQYYLFSVIEDVYYPENVILVYRELELLVRRPN
jgi:hypothetical protein